VKRDCAGVLWLALPLVSPVLASVVLERLAVGLVGLLGEIGYFLSPRHIPSLRDRCHRMGGLLRMGVVCPAKILHRHLYYYLLVAV